MMSTESDSAVASAETDPVDTSAQDVYVFPCSVVQRACWFLEQMSPGTATNNIAVRFRLNGDLRPDVLERALNELARRHETLRTRFISQDGQPMQVVEPEMPVELPLADLSASPDSAESAAAAEAGIPFDITKGPLWRTRLLRTAPRDYILLITIHHIVSDGWSIGIITEELGEIYGSLIEGTAPSLPALPIQYADYAAWQNGALENELAGQLEYWKRQLHDFQPLNLATDSPRPAKPLNRGRIRSVVLPRDVTDSLKRLSDQQGCTLFVTMLTALQALLRHESGQNDIVVRTQTAGRSRVELEPLIGWFVNSVLLRAKVPAGATFLDQLKRTHQVTLEALDHQDIPFEQIIDVAHPRQDLSYLPPFPVNFIFQRDFVKSWTRGGITLTAVPSVAAGTFVDLNVFLVERADGWRASVDVNLDVFRSETGDLFLRNFQTVLEAVARDPHVLLEHIPLPPRREGSHRLKPAERTAATRLEPRDQLESDLLAIWKDVLACDSLDIGTNFFDVGGHSLLAVRMLSMVQKRYGQSLDLAKLFVEPTVEAMARALRGQTAAAAPAPTSHVEQAPDSDGQKIDVIPVQPFGEAPPFFMVGGDHWFRPLARRLDSNQPFLGLSLMTYERRQEPTSFEEISRDLARIILGLKPAGPILLGGWCVDGAIAFEVARKLMAMNQQVALVVLIDAINPVYRRKFWSLPQRLRRALKRVQILASEVIRMRGRGALEHAWEGLRDLAMRVAQTIAPSASKTGWDVVIERADSERQEFRRLLYKAEHAYTPAPISCPVTLLRSAVTVFQDPDLGWRAVTPAGLEIIEIAADHIGMFREPYVEQLAAALRARIRAALDQRS